MASEDCDGDDALAELVEAAFESSKMPSSEVPLVESDELPDSIRLSRRFSGRDWKAISFEDVWLSRFDLCRFTDRYFHYYLPAFIVQTLRVGGLETDPLDFVQSSLTPPDSGEDYERFLTRLSLFDREQRDALREVISDLCGDSEHDRQAREFWDSY